MTVHCMIDIETWSAKRDASIISIGAVKFDTEDPEHRFDNFHVAISPGAFRPLKPFDVDPSTIIWWMGEGRKEAREHWLACDKLDLPSALVGFCEWYGNESLPTWGNGATFDLVIMANALMVCGELVPWAYKDERCYRTLRNCIPNVKGPTEAEMAYGLDPAAIPGGRVPHTALYDAQWQAVHLLRLLDDLDVGRRYETLQRQAREAQRDPSPGTIHVEGRGQHSVHAPVGAHQGALVATAGDAPQDPRQVAADLGKVTRAGAAVRDFNDREAGLAEALLASQTLVHEDAITGRESVIHRERPQPHSGDMADMIQGIGATDGQG